MSILLNGWSKTNFFPCYYILYLLFWLFFPELSFFLLSSSFPFTVIAFINEESTGCSNEEAIGAINEATIGDIIAPRYPPSCFFVLCLLVSVASSINRPDFSSDSTILIISFVSLFKMNKVNHLFVFKVL